MGQQRGLDDIYNHLYTSVLVVAESLRLKYLFIIIHVYICMWRQQGGLD